MMELHIQSNAASVYTVMVLGNHAESSSTIRSRFCVATSKGEKMLICTCPIDEECIALGTDFDCLPWCDYLKDDGLEDEE